jgi:hypothetical protein
VSIFKKTSVLRSLVNGNKLFVNLDADVSSDYLYFKLILNLLQPEVEADAIVLT